MKAKRRSASSTEAWTLRRSKRLRETESRCNQVGTRRRDPPFTSTPHFIPQGEFPLSSLLRLDVPVFEHLLPFISLSDLAALEMVDRNCLRIVREKSYWKHKLSLFLKDNSLAERLFAKYTTNMRPDHQLYHRRLYTKLKVDLSRLERNLSRSHYRESSVCLPSECNSVATDTTGRFVFAAGENQVDVFAIAETRKGAVLKLRHHVNWEGKLPNYDGVDENATHSFLVKSLGELVFVAHYDGLVSVWNWRDQSLIHMIRDNVEMEEDLDHYYDIPVITAMQVRQDKLVIGLWSEGPVTVYRVGDNPEDFSVVGKVILEGYASVHAVDIDAHLVVVAYDRSPGYVHQICVWDLEKAAPTRFISAPDVKSLCFNAAQGKLLAGATRIEVSAPLLQLFDLNDGQAIVSFKTEKGDPSDREMDYIEDFFLEGGACVWTDWCDKIVLGYTSGSVAFYSFETLDPHPTAFFKRKRFSDTYPCWIKDISFDGAYLVFNHESDVCLFDFLSLSSSKF